MESKSSRFVVYPYVPLEDNKWSISDEMLVWIWKQIETEGKTEHLFYDGKIRDIASWLLFWRTPGRYPLIVWDTQDKRVVHIGWLSEVDDILAWAHHCAVGPYKRGAWEAVREYWQQFPTVRLLMGKTPETNEKAIKFLKLCGFNIVGTIPWICNMFYEGKRVGGVISYCELQ